MKFFIKDIFSKELRIWSYLLKKSLMENFNFVQCKIAKETSRKMKLIMIIDIFLILTVTMTLLSLGILSKKVFTKKDNVFFDT